MSQRGLDSRGNAGGTFGVDSTEASPLLSNSSKNAETEPDSKRRHILDFANVMKSFIGSNFLGMPFAFRSSGIYAGIFGIMLVALITDHCCYLLVQCKQKLGSSVSVSTYGDMGMTMLGTCGKVLINIFLVFTQFGFCVGYMIFLGKNIFSLFVDTWHVDDFPFWVAFAIPALALLPLVFLKRLDKLGSTSLIADFTLVAGMGLPLFFGIVTSSYEGIGLVLPVASSMAKRAPRRYARLLHISLVLVTLLLAAFGILGYATYGDDVQQVITLNLPPKDPLTIAVKMCLILAIFLTYPMQIYPVHEVAEDILFSVKRSAPTNQHAKINTEVEDGISLSMPNKPFFHAEKVPSYFDIRRNAVRTVLVALTALIAFLVPFFSLIGGLVGALGSTVLAYLLPIVFHIQLFRIKEVSWWVLAKNIAILLFGLLVLGVGTTFAIQDIIAALKG